jgi:glycerol-1-phosphate dehydrogenase [NAD(P)+]
MRFGNHVDVPTLVRVKEGALDRVGIYLRRAGLNQVAVLQSQGLISPLPQRLRTGLRNEQIQLACWEEVLANDMESAIHTFTSLPSKVNAILGVGGGKALDVAKYVATLARLPYLAVPTSLSNDGFCSPQSSLTIAGRRRSLPAAIPYGLVIDTEVCRQAPHELTLSGVGDLVSKFTAVRDWKLSFHQTGELVDDFAALLSDGSVHAFLSHPTLDQYGMRLLATALMMNGTAMAMCGSSRPASGSEHLISHALDQLLPHPRLHGIQVGVATYLISLLQGENSSTISRLFEATGFWDHVAKAPFPRDLWIEAVSLAESIKPGYYTVLSSRDVLPEVEQLLVNDPHLQRAIRA